MKVRVLGSAAGGGFPQWNCHCENCSGLRAKKIKARPRTQSSIAISDNAEEKWLLVNASPDIRQQIEENECLRPDSDNPRGSRILGVLLIDSQIDHTSGLTFLREGEPLHVVATRFVLNDLKQGLPLLNVLDFYCGYKETELSNDEESLISLPELADTEILSVPLVAKGPPYSLPENDRQSGRASALFMTNKKTGKSLFYSPGLENIDEKIDSLLSKADVILVDGTFWENEEMLKKVGKNRTALQMGHLPLSGPEGSMAQLEKYSAERKIFIHINNTNPILIEDSQERAELESLGFEVAFDGLQIEI